MSQLITDLKPATEYAISVTVVNGVSDQDKENEFKRVCHLRTTTLEGGTINYGVMVRCSFWQLSVNLETDDKEEMLITQ